MCFSRLFKNNNIHTISKLVGEIWRYFYRDCHSYSCIPGIRREQHSRTDDYYCMSRSYTGFPVSFSCAPVHDTVRTGWNTVGRRATKELIRLAVSASSSKPRSSMHSGSRTVRETKVHTECHPVIAAIYFARRVSYFPSVPWWLHVRQRYDRIRPACYVGSVCYLCTDRDAIRT